MNMKSTKLIEELETLKDILWYIKGKLSENENSELSRDHMTALTKVINYVYNNEMENNKDN